MADDETHSSELKNPYGGGPGTGISLPPYFKPTSSLPNLRHMSCVLNKSDNGWFAFGRPQAARVIFVAENGGGPA